MTPEDRTAIAEETAAIMLRALGPLCGRTKARV